MLTNLLHPLSLSAMLMDFDWGALALPALWLGVILLAVIAEAQTADLVAIWFAPGAFVSMILAFLEVDPVVQVVVFVAVAVLCLVLTRTVFKSIFRKRNHIEKTGTDTLPGRLALVEEDIDNVAATGVVKINGQLWSARMKNPTDTAHKGDWVEIAEVVGSKLICIPKN